MSFDSQSRNRFARKIERPGSMLSSLLPGLISLAMIFAAPLAVAQGPEGAAAAAGAAGAGSDMQSMMKQRLSEMPSGEEGVNQIMSGLDERLKLTAEQQTEIRPIIEQTVAKMEKSRDKFLAGELAPMALGMQLQMAGQQAARKVEPLLNETQKVEYAAMQKEQRAEMMKAMQQAR